MARRRYPPPFEANTGRSVCGTYDTPTSGVPRGTPSSASCHSRHSGPGIRHASAGGHCKGQGPHSPRLLVCEARAITRQPSARFRDAETLRGQLGNANLLKTLPAMAADKPVICCVTRIDPQKFEEQRFPFCRLLRACRRGVVVLSWAGSAGSGQTSNGPGQALRPGGEESCGTC